MFKEKKEKDTQNLHSSLSIFYSILQIELNFHFISSYADMQCKLLLGRLMKWNLNFDWKTEGSKVLSKIEKKGIIGRKKLERKG